MKIVSIELSKIEQNENSRVIYKQSDLSELMASMKRDGLLQPIGVRKLENDKYDCVWGNRRLVVAKKLGWDKIEANISDLEEENERDFVGLIENMKRKNTSVAEDGRIFHTLRDRGLTVSEIAARLDVEELRINLAIDVYKHVPQEFIKKVVYTAAGKRNVKDRVTASTAMAILNLRRTAGLNRPQTRDIFAYASENHPTMEQISKIGPMVKNGVSIAEAIERVAGLERIVLTVYVPTAQVLKLEKKYEKKIHNIFYDYLRTNTELKVDNSVFNLSQIAKKAEAKVIRRAAVS